jgi:hypothetical protein
MSVSSPVERQIHCNLHTLVSRDLLAGLPAMPGRNAPVLRSNPVREAKNPRQNQATHRLLTGPFRSRRTAVSLFR